MAVGFFFVTQMDIVLYTQLRRYPSLPTLANPMEEAESDLLVDGRPARLGDNGNPSPNHGRRGRPLLARSGTISVEELALARLNATAGKVARGQRGGRGRSRGERGGSRRGCCGRSGHLGRGRGDQVGVAELRGLDATLDLGQDEPVELFRGARRLRCLGCRPPRHGARVEHAVPDLFGPDAGHEHLVVANLLQEAEPDPLRGRKVVEHREGSLGGCRQCRGR